MPNNVIKTKVLHYLQTAYFQTLRAYRKNIYAIFAFYATNDIFL